MTAENMYEALAREMEQAIDNVANRHVKRFFNAYPRYKKGGAIFVSEQRHTDLVVAVDMESNAVIQQIVDRYATWPWDIEVCKIVIKAGTDGQKKFMQRSNIQVYHSFLHW